MAYVAIKPCRFAGQMFLIGDSIPAELVQPGAANNLMKMGLIAADGAETGAKPAEPVRTEAPTMEVLTHVDEGDMPLNVTKEGLQSVFDVLTNKVAEAEAIIAAMEDQDALILLHVTDSRKSVKELAMARAKDLSEKDDE